jgi:hypothetical protein
MSLWTPSGEHPVDRNPEPEPQAGSAAAGEAAGPSLEDLTPEQRAQVEQMARQMEEAQARMLQAPPEAVVGQHVLALYDLAALYLSQDPPRLDAARLAIDALVGVVEQLGSRFGQAERPLRQAVTQIQMAFVEASKSSPASGGPGGGEGGG